MKTIKKPFRILVWMAAAAAVPSCAPAHTGRSSETAAVQSPRRTDTAVRTPTDETRRCAVDNSQAGLVEDLLILTPAEDGGYCRLELPLQGYSAVGFSLEYPDSWKVILAGPEGLTLLFDTRQQRRLKLQLTTTDLPLERADEATYTYEFLAPEPLVPPGEETVLREMRTVGGKRLLFLKTRSGTDVAMRWFLMRDATVYMFAVAFPAAEAESGESAGLAGCVEEMIRSVAFMK